MPQRSLKGQKPKFTTRQQFEAMVSFMEKNPKMALSCRNFGDNRAVYTELLRELMTLLNNMGPPIRNHPSEWIKVWSDFKLKIKRKLLNKNDKPAPLSALEERVVVLINSETTINKRAKWPKTKQCASDEDSSTSSQYVNATNQSFVNCGYKNSDSLKEDTIIEISNSSSKNNNENTTENIEIMQPQNSIEMLEETDSQAEIKEQQNPSCFTEVYLEHHNDNTMSYEEQSNSLRLLKRKIDHHNDTLATTNLVSDDDERHDIFGKFVASELKRIRNEHISNEVRWGIQVALREALQRDATTTHDT